MPDTLPNTNTLAAPPSTTPTTPEAPKREAVSPVPPMDACTRDGDTGPETVTSAAALTDAGATAETHVATFAHPEEPVCTDSVIDGEGPHAVTDAKGTGAAPANAPSPAEQRCHDVIMCLITNRSLPRQQRQILMLGALQLLDRPTPLKFAPAGGLASLLWQADPAAYRETVGSMLRNGWVSDAILKSPDPQAISRVIAILRPFMIDGLRLSGADELVRLDLALAALRQFAALYDQARMRSPFMLRSPTHLSEILRLTAAALPQLRMFNKTVESLRRTASRRGFLVTASRRA